MVTHILLADTPDREDGFNRSKCSFFLNMVMLHINLMGITKCSRMVANFCPQTPPGPWGGGLGQNSTLSEHGHVAYQLKGITKCSRMVANILPADPTQTQGMGPLVKIKLFQNMVMLHIKLKRIKNAPTWWQIFSPRTHYPPLTLRMGSVGQNSFF